MTEQNAIRNLKCFPDWNIDDGWLKDDEMRELCDMSISALEKQIPMKAKFENREIIRHRHNPKGKPEWEKLIKADWLCSNCKSPVGEDNYCGYCGQRLDWNDAR